MGKYPFTVTMNQVLRDTDPWYSQSTRDERRRKFRRIYAIVQELRESGKVSTTSPKNMTEQDVIQFIGWCKERLDNATSAKYLRYLQEVLQKAGNASLESVRLRRKRDLPRATAKEIRTLASDDLAQLLYGDWELEDPYLDSTAKAALVLYSHTGLRPSELRLSRLKDLNLARMEIRVSQPKGHGRWASGEELAPVMPGAAPTVRLYLEERAKALEHFGLEPASVEPLFPYIGRDGKTSYWTPRQWNRLKVFVGQASGVSFRWKDLRPTFAQYAKDKGAAIEAVSKALRHTSTRTTEMYYARIRSESAFSQMRQAWEAPVAAKSQNAD
jgi:integrase